MASAPPSSEVPPSLLGKGCSGFTPGQAAAQRAKERRAGQVTCQPRAGSFRLEKSGVGGFLRPLLCRFFALPSRPWSFAMPLPLLSLALLLARVTRPGLAGPVSTCDANGSLYFLGEWYSLDSDHCIQCECTAEGAACARTDCAALPPACIHVSHYPGDCCPRCERVGCEHRGQVYDLGQHFQPSECEQCACDLDGIARCLVADCAPPPCVNPIYEKGHCCPICKEGANCYVDGSQHNIIPAGDSVWIGPCIRCRCHDGQDASYWEGNRLAKCEQLAGCRVPNRHHS